MKCLTLHKETFFEMLSALIASGVTFEAVEDGEMITITFDGGH